MPEISVFCILIRYKYRHYTAILFLKELCVLRKGNIWTREAKSDRSRWYLVDLTFTVVLKFIYYILTFLLTCYQFRLISSSLCKTKTMFAQLWNPRLNIFILGKQSLKTIWKRTVLYEFWKKKPLLKFSQLLQIRANAEESFEKSLKNYLSLVVMLWIVSTELWNKRWFKV